MSKLVKIIALLVVVMLGAAAIFLLTWDIPAPSERVEKTLPDDRFPR